MSTLLEKIDEAKNHLLKKITSTPDFAVVLGSGASNFSKEVQKPVFIPYGGIPFFPKTTIKGHAGQLIFGEIGKKKVLVMSGRFHYYEGHSMDTITFPIRLFNALGIKKLILSNASGGVNPNFKIGDVMLIKDHINLMPEHPLRGPNEESLGPRFVSMHAPYDSEMLDLAESIAMNHNVSIQKGVYLGLQGPSFETPAEYGMVQNLGADAVGMSTVSEVIVAKHMDMRVFALSIITDLGGASMKDNLVSHEEVLQAADKAMPVVCLIVKELIENFPD